MRKARKVELTPYEKRLDLGRWLSSHAALEERSGPEWTLVCPLCGRPKLAVHVTRKAWQCWHGSCKFSGWSPTVLVAAILGVTYQRAVAVVAGAALGAELAPIAPLAVPEQQQRRQFDIPQAPLPPGTVWELPPHAAAYAAFRGILPAHVRAFGLGAVCGDRSGSRADWALSGRLLFPAWSQVGRLVYWVARAVDDRGPKTINTPRACRQVNHHPACTCEHEAWGLPPVPSSASADEAVIGLHLLERGGTAHVVEGPVDAAVCGPGFVATMGSTMSMEQASLIVSRGVAEVIVIGDGDAAGLSFAHQAAELLRNGVRTRRTTCPDKLDPAKLGKAATLRVAEAAPPPGGIAPLRVRRGRIAYVPRPKRIVAPLKKS